MPLADFLRLFNLLALTIFVVLVILAFSRMFYRLAQFLRRGINVPILLRRDLFLFGAFGLYFGGILILSRLMNHNLASEPLWQVPMTFIVLGAMAYWVWVEFRLEKGES